MTSRNSFRSRHLLPARGTLLIVDDEPGPRESLSIAFCEQYKVISASSGKEAIDLASNNSVDVVICDIRMPDISGTDVLRELKQKDARIEIIMLTAYESVETARAAVTYGAADYISKPFDLSKLSEVVARCFERRQLSVAREGRLEQLQAENKDLEAELVGHERKLAAQMPAKPTLQSKDEEPFMHWREYYQILLERKWISITALVVAVTFAAIWNFKTTPIYRATTRLQVDSENLKILNIQDVVTADTRDVEYLNTQLKILQSCTVAEQAVKSLGLDQNKEFVPNAGPNTDYAEAVQRCVSVKVVRDSRLLDIGAEHPNPQIATLLANGMAREFIRQNLERKLTASLDAVRWLGEQADEYRQKVEKSEATLQEYREKTRSVSLEDRQNIVIQKLQELNSAVTKAKTDRLVAEIEWNEVNEFLDAGQNLVSCPAVAANSQVAALRQQLAGKQITIATLRVRYKDKHPTLIPALTELKIIEAELDKARAQAADNIKANYLTAQAKEQSLQQALKEQEQEALDLSRKLIDYTVLKRNSDADQQLYNSILARMKEAGVTGKLESNNIRVVDAALTPSAPYKPRKAQNILLAAVLGLVCGVGLSFGMHFYEDKVKTYEDVESYLHLPLLSIVPTVELREVREKARVVEVEPHSLPSEAFRNLRASLSLSPSAKDSKCLLVTSSAPGEGKSLVASNLAIVLANNNHKTLLIDADMRHPTQHKVFAIESKRGLSLHLADSTLLRDVIHQTDIPNLEVLVAGQVPPNASELLGGARMRGLLEAACQRYDRVVIDSPPVTAVSDPLILLPHVDGVVFVIHFSKVRRDVVARSVQKLRESGTPILGAVLNNVDAERNSYYYYPYRSHYHHHNEGKGLNGESRPEKTRGVGIEV